MSIVEDISRSKILSRILDPEYIKNIPD